jgi:DNA-directed RNA polymerase specialized sigma24 family protein
MTGESEMSRSLNRAFLAALLLTASKEFAEFAVSDAISALSWNQISGDSLLVQTAKCAIQLLSDLPDQFEQACSVLPLELQRVLFLGPILRRCFVLRVLLGLPAKTCSEILYLPVQEVENSLFLAMQELPLTVENAYVGSR